MPVPSPDGFKLRELVSETSRIRSVTKQVSKWITIPGARRAVATRTDLFLYSVQGVLGDPEVDQGLLHSGSGRMIVEMRLDNLREGSILALVASERLVGDGVDRDRLEGHDQKACTTQGMQVKVPSIRLHPWDQGTGQVSAIGLHAAA